MLEKGEFVAYRGNIYMLHGTVNDQHYRRLELYLPSAEGTYQEPIETTFYRMVERLEKRLLTAKCADGIKYKRVGDKMMPIPNKKPKA